MSRSGDALAVWGEVDDSGNVALVSSMRRAGTSQWGPPSRVPISSPDIALFDFGGFSFALDAAGNATLVEQDAIGNVEATTRPADAATWGAPVVLGSGGGSGAWYERSSSCVDPRIALDGDGGAVVIWGGGALYSARRAAGSQA